MKKACLVSRPRRIRFADLVRRVRESVEVDPRNEYFEIGVRSHGLGTFHKDGVSGKDLGSKSVFRVHSNCLVFNIVFAWEGAVAITTEADAGRIASHRFPMFRVLDDFADIEYLRSYFTSPLGRYLLRLASPGGAGRNRTLNSSKLGDIELKLPSLRSQKAVARLSKLLDETASRIELAVTARERRKMALLQQVLIGEIRCRGLNPAKWTRARLAELAQVNPAISMNLDPNLVVSFVSMADVSAHGRIRSSRVRRHGDLTSGYAVFRDGDVLIAKITPCFENGKGALARGLVNGVGFGSSEFHVVRPGPRLLAEYFNYLAQSRGFRKAGASCMTGSAGQRRVPAQFVGNFLVPLPPIDEQRSIATLLELVDEELLLLDRQLAAVRKLKRGLMQKLLTGELEVPAADEPKGDEVHA